MSSSKCLSNDRNINFPELEEDVLRYWKKIDAFRTSLKQAEGKPRYNEGNGYIVIIARPNIVRIILPPPSFRPTGYTFYDGPPYATGMPHYGHILAGTIKDVVTRYAHQTGHYVDRRFGWDCHGLPIEYQIDQKFGIMKPDDVLKFGIAKYNDECRKIVMSYSEEWKEIVQRLGRWIDFENDYKTMYTWFMESTWHVFKQLYDRGYVYNATKVVPYSTACHTALSNFECEQNYREIEDTAVFIHFPLIECPNVSLLAWTCKVWSLPSMLCLCVNANMDYVKIKDKIKNAIYILMECRLGSVYADTNEYEILKRFKGRDLVGKTFEQPFKYFEHMRKKTGAFRVVSDDYPNSESGTGIEALSPHFGEVDYRICFENGVITKDLMPACPVDECGLFTHEIPELKGIYVKDAEELIIKTLKQKSVLVHQEVVNHKYPFCWRSDTPLIFKTVKSWFIKVKHARERLIDNNTKTNWVPNFVKTDVFGDWLKECKDWVVSRNRYWGTPIPIWMSDDEEEVVCVGSVEELYQLTGKKVNDLHRETVDHLTIPSKMGKGVLRRIPEVLDCWFDIGTVPYAHLHYPFENEDIFQNSFPADFIAEGLDQTRGWFYTLLVVSTLLFDKPPAKNRIVNGFVKASDGEKMSKRKKNYSDPIFIVNKYGADALRLYLCSSPAVRAESICFKEEEVAKVILDVLQPWHYACEFVLNFAEKYEKETGSAFIYNPCDVLHPKKPIDRWMLSSTHSFLLFIKEELAAYRLDGVMTRIVKLLSHLSLCIRLLKKQETKWTTEGAATLKIVFGLLYAMTVSMAPFVPFFTDHLHRKLRDLLDPLYTEGLDTRSVHFMMIPEHRHEQIDSHIETAMERVFFVITTGRRLRESSSLPFTEQLNEISITSEDENVLDDIIFLGDFIKEDLNVKNIKVAHGSTCSLARDPGMLSENESLQCPESNQYYGCSVGKEMNVMLITSKENIV